MKKIFLLFLISTGVLLADFTRDDNAQTVFDTTTNLMWQDDDMPTKMKWEESKSYCENLELGGYSDWHLPTKVELDSLIDKTVYDPSIDEAFQYVNSYRYWTSTPRESKNAAWYVNFSYGHKDGYYITDSNYVRCVRAGE